jgi:hypothetical protein
MSAFYNDDVIITLRGLKFSFFLPVISRWKPKNFKQKIPLKFFCFEKMDFQCVGIATFFQLFKLDAKKNTHHRLAHLLYAIHY